MKIESLMIGDELLDGRVVDTNSARFATAIGQAGQKLRARRTVIDDIDDIVSAAQDIAARGTDLCVVAGGLGPTDDDLTSLAFARLAGVELQEDPAVVVKLREIFEARGREMTPNQLRQAKRPTGAELLRNPVGLLQVSRCFSMAVRSWFCPEFLENLMFWWKHMSCPGSLAMKACCGDASCVASV